MRKKTSHACHILYILILIYIVCCFMFAKTDKISHTGESENMQPLIPSEQRVIDGDTREFVFNGENFAEEHTCLSFLTSHLDVEVYKDSELIYELKPIESIFGRTPGSVWNFIEPGKDCDEVVVRIHAVYPVVRNEEIDFYTGQSAQTVLELMRGSALAASVSLLELGIGIFLMIYYVLVNRKIKVGIHVLFFAVFIVMLGLWSMNGTTMMTLLMSNTVASSNLGYIMIMLMIAPFALFINGFLYPSDKWMATTISYLALLNLVLCTILHMFGIADFRETAVFTHILIALDIPYLGYALAHYVQEKGIDRTAKANLVGMVILIFSFGENICSFYVYTRQDDAMGRFGFLVYIALMTWQAASNSLDKLHEGQKAAIYKELALKDVLTGLYNRNAYDEWMNNRLDCRGVAIVAFDLNNLKLCNDRFGHTAGDAYLKAAADTISGAFAKDGFVYRMGGDEFCVVIEHAQESQIEEDMRKFKELQQERNRVAESVPVQIACGYAIYDSNIDRDIEETRNRADVHMYENKRILKESGSTI